MNGTDTKTKKAISYFKSGDYAHAFGIFKTFKFGFLRKEMRSIEIACDCFHGHTHFYKQLGIDTVLEIGQAMSIIKTKYRLP